MEKRSAVWKKKPDLLSQSRTKSDDHPAYGGEQADHVEELNAALGIGGQD